MVRHDHSIEANRYGEHLPPRCFSSLRTGPGRTLGRFSFVLAFLLRTRRWAARFFSAVIERYERVGVPTEPEERFVCPECGLDEFPEVTTKCGHRSCKQCAIVCDDCGSIWCVDCTYPEGELKLCDACLSEREQAKEAAEAA